MAIVSRRELELKVRHRVSWDEAAETAEIVHASKNLEVRKGDCHGPEVRVEAGSQMDAMLKQFGETGASVRDQSIVSQPLPRGEKVYQVPPEVAEKLIQLDRSGQGK